jgi:hypothetical protein
MHALLQHACHPFEVLKPFFVRSVVYHAAATGITHPHVQKAAVLKAQRSQLPLLPGSRGFNCRCPAVLR